jgi:uncharacterized protein YecT (DUF1311 family)
MKKSFSVWLILCGLASLVLSLYASPSSASEWPSSVEGEWQVVQVHINTEATATGQYFWNDPRLLGRLFTFETDSFWDDTPEFVGCAAPNIRSIDVKLPELIPASMAGYGYPAKRANSKNYEIDQLDAQTALVYQISCGKGPWHGELGTDEFRGAWLASLKGDRLLLRWFGETILVLRRVPSNAKAVPSFSCGNAHSTTEKTICSSYELSAFDKSVSDAYQLLLKQTRTVGGEIDDVVDEQKTWIKSRNDCASDQRCLMKLMRDRLETLASEIQT